jgi:methionine synthase II (cobalamin-independent)
VALTGGIAMIHGFDRIVTTHAGSLPRSPELRDLVLAKANG